MTKRDTEIVSAVRRALAERVDPQQFGLWFAGGDCLACDGLVLTVRAASEFKLDRLKKFFRDALTDAARAVCGDGCELEFAVDPSLNGAASDGGLDHADTQLSDDPKAGAKAARRKFQTFRTFVASESSRLALTACEMAAHQPGELNPIFLHGPSGTGKTHLLESVWCEAHRAPQRRRIVYLTSEQFTTYFLEALHGSGLPSFRNKYRQLDLLLIDDVQFFIGKQATLNEVQQTIDHLVGEGCQVVLTADRSPAELPQLGESLTTRLASGLQCHLKPPDQQARLGITRQLATRMKLEPPHDVLQYVAESHRPRRSTDQRGVEPAARLRPGVSAAAGPRPGGRGAG